MYADVLNSDDAAGKNTSFSRDLKNVFLCWSAEGVKEALTSSVLQILRQINDTTRPVAVMRMDGGRPPCPLDAALNAQENSTGGAMWHTINEIAASVATEFPSASLYPPKQPRICPRTLLGYSEPISVLSGRQPATF